MASIVKRVCNGWAAEAVGAVFREAGLKVGYAVLVVVMYRYLRIWAPFLLRVLVTRYERRGNPILAVAGDPAYDGVVTARGLVLVSERVRFVPVTDGDVNNLLELEEFEKDIDRDVSGSAHSEVGHTHTVPEQVARVVDTVAAADLGVEHVLPEAAKGYRMAIAEGTSQMPHFWYEVYRHMQATPIGMELRHSPGRVDLLSGRRQLVQYVHELGVRDAHVIEWIDKVWYLLATDQYALFDWRRLVMEQST